ncbi:hypothetical protein [Nocardiopsis sp. CNR-923]|uniref:hypothetical protein n=1 Tax=Nocardiopsis sp. CNR-923 TaxID=1904965 RepID=UPI00117F5C9E|nr:hypothetical protein [Nocardiopsis sp. CNR-923]
MSENRPAGNPRIYEEERARQLVAARWAALQKAIGSGEGGGGGGNKEIAEALLLTTLGATVVRGRLSSAGYLRRAAVEGALRKRSARSRGEGFFGEAETPFSPDISMAGLSLARQADPSLVARKLGLDADRVREVQRNLRIQDMDAVLRGDYHRGVIEQAARVNVWRQGPDPNTPPEQLWRRALDEDVDISSMKDRERALIWLSAANSTEPGAREAQAKAYDELPIQMREAIERHTVKDINFTGDPHSARIDANSIMSAASPQANGRPMETMEQLWTRSIPAFKDPREDLGKLRDTAESLSAAVLDGRAPVNALTQVKANLMYNKALPDFTKDFEAARQRSQARADKGLGRPFFQGDGILDALDKARGFPVTDQPRGRAGFIAAGNAIKAQLRAHGTARTANPRLTMDSRLPETIGQVHRAHRLGGASGVVSPHRAVTAQSDVGYPQGKVVRTKHRDGGGVRLGRVEIARGNHETRAYAEGHRRGRPARGGESAVGLPKKKQHARVALARLKERETDLNRTTTTSKPHRAAAR